MTRSAQKVESCAETCFFPFWLLNCLSKQCNAIMEDSIENRSVAHF